MCILIVKFVNYHHTLMFLLAIHFFRKLSPKLVFRTGNAPDIRDIDIGKVCNSLSAKHTEDILG